MMAAAGLTFGHCHRPPPYRDHLGQEFSGDNNWMAIEDCIDRGGKWLTGYPMQCYLQRIFPMNRFRHWHFVIRIASIGHSAPSALDPQVSPLGFHHRGFFIGVSPLGFHHWGFAIRVLPSGFCHKFCHWGFAIGVLPLGAKPQDTCK